MKQEKYGFIYIWYDKRHKRYYVGCHWGTENDGYICSSNWMRDAYRRRPEDFKRRIIKRNIKHRPDMYVEEQRYLEMMKPEELRIRYYNLCRSSKDIWHKYEDHIKTVGQKISASKKGKSTGPCSPEKAAKISEAKKGIIFTDEHRRKISEAKKGRRHTEEWKLANAERLKQQWSDGTRKRKEPKKTMTKEEQGKLHSQRLKQLWANPIWAEVQRKKLSENHRSRKPK